MDKQPVDLTVFVDDAVLGRFPGVCVKHGDATDEWAVLSRPVGTGNLGVLWLLLLLGPIGLVVLAVIHGTRGRDDVLTVKVPCCSEVTRRFNAAKWWRRLAGVATVVLAILVTISAHHGASGVWPLLTGCLALATALALAEVVHETKVCHRSTVRIEIDASRRWVTLGGVHPSFKSSVLAGDLLGDTAPAPRLP